MKMRTLLHLSVLSLVMTATPCSHAWHIDAPSATDGGGIALTQRIVLQAERAVHFSSPASLDTFRLVGRGTDTLGAQMTFTIISPRAETLFVEHFPAIDLIGYGLVDTDDHKVTDSERRAFIAQRVAHFFDDREFSPPKDAPAFAVDCDDEVWEELEADSTAVGFHFLTGEENHRLIAYVKDIGKVVVYASYD